jgi:hypothetical protein
MSVVKAKLRENAAEFISLHEVFDLLIHDGEGCSLVDAAQFLCQSGIESNCNFLPDFMVYDKISGVFAPATPEEDVFLRDEIKRIASGAVDRIRMGGEFDRNDVGFDRSKLISFMEPHGIDFAGGKSKSLPKSSDVTRQLELEAENTRLIERLTALEAELAAATEKMKWTQRELIKEFDQRAGLQQQLQEATAAPQQAPQEAGSPPQQATAAPQDDDEKPMHMRERTTFLNIVGAMLDLLVTSGAWKSEASLIEALDAAYGKRGLKPRTLQAKFAEAKLSLKQD